MYEDIGMSCFLLPNTQYLKVAFLPSAPAPVVPRVVLGYQTYTPNQGPAVATTAPTLRFPGQPTLATVARQPTTTTFHPAAVPTGPISPSQNGAQALQLAFQQTVNGRTIVPGFHRNGFRTGFKLGLRGVKRKCDDTSSNGSVDSALNDLCQPLYCKVCRVTLNAQAQAKQHYEGKNHARKAKMFLEGKEDDEDSNGDSVSSSPNGTSSEKKPQPTAEINPEIYCKICGVSFNSLKQSRQHYQGKNHAKKVRATNTINSENHYSGAKLLSKYTCLVCKLPCFNQEQLDLHIQAARHAVSIHHQERMRAAMNGRWNHKQLTLNLPHISKSQSLQQQSSSTEPLPSNDQPTSKKAKLTDIPKNETNNNTTVSISSTLDLSNYKTPSGSYYCSTCNMTLSSEPQMMQHVESKKHRSNDSASPQSNGDASMDESRSS